MSIKLKGSSDGSVSFDAPADTSPSGSDITLVLPTTVGSAEQFLKNSGTAGTLEFSSMVETSTGDVQARRARSNAAGDVALSVQPSDSTIHYGLRIDAANNSLNLDRASGTPANLLAIDSSGRVGIGTTATQQALTIDVNDSGTSQGSFNGINIANTNTTANNGSAITFGQTVPGNSNARIGVIQTARGPSESQEMFFGLLGSGSYSERMRIDSSGNIGVGASSPTDSNGFGRCIDIRSNTGAAIYLRDSDDITNDTFAIGRDNGASYLITNSGYLQFSVAGSERMRITSGGYFKASDSASYISTSDDVYEFNNSTVSANAFRIRATNSSYNGTVSNIFAVRAATSSYWLIRGLSSSGSASADNEFYIRGDGNAFADGSWSGGGADYAEYFEWSDGNTEAEDRRGVSVVLDGDKIREAVTGEEPIGVISGNPSVVGDADMDRWKGKYLRDDYGSYVLDEDGYRQLNPDYDSDVEYVQREDRPEWDTVGLMGKLRIRKGQVTGTRWIKMRDVSDTVEEWLVR